MHWFERIAQRRIDEAAAKGQLQGLPGEGRPLNPERLRESSDDVLHRMMADAGFLPEEFQLRKEVEANRATLAQIEDPVERAQLQRRIALLELRANIATDARLKMDEVNVKAKTSEKLGPMGREEGIAAQAVCLIERA